MAAVTNSRHLLGDTASCVVLWSGRSACMWHLRRFVILYAVFINGVRGTGWGSGGAGEAMGATLVSAVPLPANPADDNECGGHGIQRPREVRARSSAEGTGRDSDS